MDYDAVLAQVLDLLQREQRLSYRILKRRFALDDNDLEDLKDDLIYAKKLAMDEDGRVLVWTGGTSNAPPTASPVSPPATSEVSPAQGEATPTIPHTPEAERRKSVSPHAPMVLDCCASCRILPVTYAMMSGWCINGVAHPRSTACIPTDS